LKTPAAAEDSMIGVAAAGVAAADASCLHRCLLWRGGDGTAAVARGRGGGTRWRLRRGERDWRGAAVAWLAASRVPSPPWGVNDRRGGAVRSFCRCYKRPAGALFILQGTSSG